MTQKTIQAAEELEKNDGIQCSVLHLATIKPLDGKILKTLIPNVEKIITVEENLLAGGFGSTILEFTSDYFPEHLKKISRVGLSDKFINQYGTQDQLFEENGLSPKNLYNFVKNFKS